MHPAAQILLYCCFLTQLDLHACLEPVRTSFALLKMLHLVVQFSLHVGSTFATLRCKSASTFGKPRSTFAAVTIHLCDSVQSTRLKAFAHNQKHLAWLCSVDSIDLPLNRTLQLSVAAVVGLGCRRRPSRRTAHNLWHHYDMEMAP